MKTPQPGKIIEILNEQWVVALVDVFKDELTLTRVDEKTDANVVDFRPRSE